MKGSVHELVEGLERNIRFWQNALLFALTVCFLLLVSLMILFAAKNSLSLSNKKLVEDYVMLTSAINLGCIAAVPGQLVWHTVQEDGESRCIQFRQPVSRDNKMIKGKML